VIPRGWLDRYQIEVRERTGKVPTKDSLTVMNENTDPYRLDQHSNHKHAAWLRDELIHLGIDVDLHVPPLRTIHVRGLHYALIGRTKPNGTTYSNTRKDYDWLSIVAAAVRWLGYVPFESIVDERNTEPVIYRWSRPEPLGGAMAGAAEVPHESDFAPTVFTDGFEGAQPYHLVMIGEKSSLGSVLAPVAKRYAADLYLPAGHLSTKHTYDLAKSAVTDGRPMRIFYFADCDPSGWQMPIAVAHKLWTMRKHGFPDADIQLYRVGLTPDQVREHDLPGTVIDGDTGASARLWIDEMRVDQTEIDALVARLPHVLKQLATTALDPFYDHGLRRRVEALEDDWRARAEDALEQHLAGTDASDLLAAIADATTHLAALDGQLRRLVEDVVLPPLPDDLDGEAPADYGTPLLDTSRPFGDHVEILHRDKGYDASWRSAGG
jgi:hypothetical protein